MKGLRSLRAATAIACCAILALALSGCDFLGEYLSAGGYRPGPGADASSHHLAPKLIGLRLTYEDFEEFLEGRYEPIGPGVAEVHDKVVTGPFHGTLPFRAGPFRPATASAAHPISGTFIADLNGTTNSNDGTAQMTGTGALVFKNRKQGVACFSISAAFTEHGTVGTGTFRSTGGTKGSATSRFNGSFTEAVTVSGSGHADSGRIKGRAKLGTKPTPPPAACKALLAKIP